MESLETLRNVGNRKIATGLAIAAGAFGVSACGGDGLPESSFKNNLHVEPIKQGDGYERWSGIEVELEEVHAYCDGKQLVKARVERLETDKILERKSFTFPKHPACQDGKLTSEDDFTPDVARIDEHQTDGEYQDGLYCVPDCSDESQGNPRYVEVSCWGYQATLKKPPASDYEVSSPALDPACEDRQITPKDDSIISVITDRY